MIQLKDIYERIIGIPVKGNIQCPFHEGDDTPSLHLYNDHFYCFGCGKAGKPATLISKIKGISYSEAMAEIAKEFGLPEYEKKDIVDKDAYDAKVKRTKLLEDFARSFSTLLPKEEYRGISYKVLKENLIGFYPEEASVKSDETTESIGLTSPMFRKRIMIPIKNQWGFIEGFIGRKTNNDSSDPKYLLTAGIKKPLYNWDEAKNFSTIIVVEGVFDALSFKEMGCPNVVSLLGCELSDQHKDLLQNKNLILVLDNDDPGNAGTIKIIQQLRERIFNLKVGILPEGIKDPNELLISGEERKISKVDAIDFAIHYWKEKLPLDKAWEKVAALIGSDQPEFRGKYPLNLGLNPILIKQYWEKFYKTKEKKDDVEV